MGIFVKRSNAFKNVGWVEEPDNTLAVKNNPLLNLLFRFLVVWRVIYWFCWCGQESLRAKETDKHLLFPGLHWNRLSPRSPNICSVQRNSCGACLVPEPFKGTFLYETVEPDNQCVSRSIWVRFRNGKVDSQWLNRGLLLNFFCTSWEAKYPYDKIGLIVLSSTPHPVFFNRAAQKELVRSTRNVFHHRIIK